VETS
jgi:hypothetical protein